VDIHVYFSDYFEVLPEDLEAYGAFNISLITDLPLFIDPFLLFNSKKKKYQQLHEDMIEYLMFLRDRSQEGSVSKGVIGLFYRFPEVKETWFGFSKTGNEGRGLGVKFGQALNAGFEGLFPRFGQETVTQSSHLEKLCLIRDGVGRDMISDFTTNLILRFLCQYTEKFGQKHIDPKYLRNFSVRKSYFNYKTESWVTEQFTLPCNNGEYVLLTPKDILTKDDIWISKQDFVSEFEDIPRAIENVALRAQIENYFQKRLLKRTDKKKPTKRDKEMAIRETALRFPEVFDFYIRHKEMNGEKAVAQGIEKVAETQAIFIDQAKELIEILAETDFYKRKVDTLEDARRRALYLKHVIEDNAGWRLFYLGDKPVHKEEDVQILYRLTWYGTVNDCSREVNDGRGPVDFKASYGAFDKTLIEIKLASNSQLEKNLKNQLEVYKSAADTEKGLVIILFFSEQEERKLERILRKLKAENSEDIITIDARRDNKLSGSKAGSNGNNPQTPKRMDKASKK